MRIGAGRAAMSLVLCGCSAATVGDHGPPAALKRALTAAYNRPFTAFASGDAVSFCASFTTEAQHSIAHRLGAATCVAALKPRLRSIGPVSQSGLRTIEHASDREVRDARQHGKTATLRIPTRRRRVLHFRLERAGWLIADTPRFGTDDVRSTTGATVSRSAYSAWFDY